jgi:hypothetical protein
MVYQRGGLPVTTASLVLLSRTYRFGDSTNHLFEIIDKTAEVTARVEAYEAMAHSVAEILFAAAPPPPALVSACRECRFFAEQCLGAGVAHTVLELPSLHHTKRQALADSGIVDLFHVPDDFRLTDRQLRVKNAAATGEPFIGAGLRDALRQISWPCHYLDFETVMTALPLYADHRCHQQVLTQFSVHRRDGVGAVPAHREYLADAARDCERELAAALVDALRDRGAIVVYSSFEQTRIKALCEKVPELRGALQAILGRLVDLLKVINDHVYHPDFRGSFSIKRVLPALVPELSYADLAIGDGDTAIARFARMARGESLGGEVHLTRAQLLEYCKLDTLAMLRLHETLILLSR